MFDIITNLKTILAYIERQAGATWQSALDAAGNIMKAVAALFPVPAPVPPVPIPVIHRYSAASAADSIRGWIAELEKAHASGAVGINMNWAQILADVQRLVTDIISGLFA